MTERSNSTLKSEESGVCAGRVCDAGEKGKKWGGEKWGGVCAGRVCDAGEKGKKLGGD